LRLQVSAKVREFGSNPHPHPYLQIPLVALHFIPDRPSIFLITTPKLLFIFLFVFDFPLFLPKPQREEAAAATPLVWVKHCAEGQIDVP
jgi:hypothetical protein